MLKGVSPLISPELMYVLMRMGHGDEIVLADGNFPADSHASRIVRADGLSVPAVLEAILDFFPLDTFVESPAAVMDPVDNSGGDPPIWAEFEQLTNQSHTSTVKLERVERFEFYERAKQAYAVVATSETAVYANLILKKGVVAPK